MWFSYSTMKSLCYVLWVGFSIVTRFEHYDFLIWATMILWFEPLWFKPLWFHVHWVGFEPMWLYNLSHRCVHSMIFILSNLMVICMILWFKEAVAVIFEYKEAVVAIFGQYWLLGYLTYTDVICDFLINVVLLAYLVLVVNWLFPFLFSYTFVFCSFWCCYRALVGAVCCKAACDDGSFFFFFLKV